MKGGAEILRGASMNQAVRDNFERAFRTRVTGCRRTCNCGREFYDAANEGYSWEDGDLAPLEKDPQATPLNHAVGMVEFEGREYVSACTCWHKRAETIINFLLGHKDGIVRFLTLEKQRLRDLEDRSPAVEP